MRLDGQSSEPNPRSSLPLTQDPWLILAAGLIFAMIAGLLVDWPNSITVFCAVLQLFTACHQAKRVSDR